MRGPLIVGLAVLLMLVIAYSSYLLLQSCGLRLPFSETVISICEPAESRLRRDRTADLGIETASLVSEVQALERQLAGLQCVAEPPPPPPPPPPPKPKPAKKPAAKTDSGLKPGAFDNRDISVMKGCWRLVSEYQTSNIRTRKLTTFRQWNVCFDDKGNGRQTMRATNGVKCDGTLKGRIDGRKRLVMRERKNLRCSNGSYIYRRDITCTLDSAGRANCVSVQPEVGGRGTAILRRSN